jgi:hypothetical protein
MTTTSNSQSVVGLRTPKVEPKKTAPAKAKDDQHVEEEATLTQSKKHPQRAASNFATHEHNERWPDIMGKKNEKMRIQRVTVKRCLVGPNSV